MAEKLTRREQTIINYKANGGNMKKAMIDAGYSESYADKNSRYLLANIREQIQSEQAEIKAAGIKSVEDIQLWWSNMVENEEIDLRDRIRCSENLVKSQGGFMDKVQVNANINNPFSGLTTEELRELVRDG